MLHHVMHTELSDSRKKYSQFLFHLYSIFAMTILQNTMMNQDFYSFCVFILIKIGIKLFMSCIQLHCPTCPVLNFSTLNTCTKHNQNFHLCNVVVESSFSMLSQVYYAKYPEPTASAIM